MTNVARMRWTASPLTSIKWTMTETAQSTFTPRRATWYIGLQGEQRWRLHPHCSDNTCNSPNTSRAVDLGLLQAKAARSPESAAKKPNQFLDWSDCWKRSSQRPSSGNDTTDQEAIVLCRVLNSPSGVARELWSSLRIAVGVSHGMSLPRQLWSNDAFRSIGGLIDKIFCGEASNASLISKDGLISAFPNNGASSAPRSSSRQHCPT